MRFFVEELMLLFCIFEFWIERSKEVLQAFQVGGRPLLRAKDDECVSKEIFVVLCCGGARLGKRRGRAASQKKNVYDCTMGFQGEDPAQKLHRNVHCTNFQ